MQSIFQAYAKSDSIGKEQIIKMIKLGSVPLTCWNGLCLGLAE